MIFYCIQLHLVRKCPLAGQDVFSLQIGIDHQYRGGIILHISHNDRHGVQICKLCGVFPTMPGDDLIAALWSGAGNQRRKHTELRNAFHRPGHGIIVQNFERVVFEREKFADGNLLYLLPLFFLPGFFGRKNIIETFQCYV